MSKKPNVKKQRALMFLELMEDNNVIEISILLGVPLSTIQKHDNALKRLTGRLGQHLKVQAFKSLAMYDAGYLQRESVSVSTDDRMVSDLVAMRWAITERCEAIALESEAAEILKAESEAKASRIRIGSSEIEERLRRQLRLPINNVTEAFNIFLALIPSAISEASLEALDDLTEVIIDLEEVLKS